MGQAINLGVNLGFFAVVQVGHDALKIRIIRYKLLISLLEVTKLALG